MGALGLGVWMPDNLMGSSAFVPALLIVMLVSVVTILTGFAGLMRHALDDEVKILGDGLIVRRVAWLRMKQSRYNWDNVREFHLVEAGNGYFAVLTKLTDDTLPEIPLFIARDKGGAERTLRQLKNLSGK